MDIDYDDIKLRLDNGEKFGKIMKELNLQPQSREIKREIRLRYPEYKIVNPEAVIKIGFNHIKEHFGVEKAEQVMLKVIADSAKKDKDK